MAQDFGKVDIINHLAGAHDLRRYLELCSLTTGHMFAKIDRDRLDAQRLMYRCPDHHSDGLRIDFRSSSLDISECLRQIRLQELSYDVVLVDPFHEYEPSLRDLRAAFDLIGQGGYLVVHDCLPPSKEMATPQYIGGSWCGVTYKAYLDFVMGRRDLSYYTVDTDFGCGVIRRLGAGAGGSVGSDDDDEYLIERWRELGQDFESAFRFFEQHQEALLKLRSVEEFLTIETPRPH